MHLQMVNVTSFMWCIFYHNKKKLKEDKDVDHKTGNTTSKLS